MVSQITDVNNGIPKLPRLGMHPGLHANLRLLILSICLIFEYIVCEVDKND